MPINTKIVCKRAHNCLSKYIMTALYLADRYVALKWQHLRPTSLKVYH